MTGGPERVVWVPGQLALPGLPEPTTEPEPGCGHTWRRGPFVVACNRHEPGWHVRIHEFGFEYDREPR